MNISALDDHQKAAARFVEARRAAQGFSDFPGPIPTDLDAAYRIQQAAIASWGDRIAGWKVGRIQPHLVEQLGAERFMGPIFADSVSRAAETNVFPMTAGGSALFEAEVVILANADAPADKVQWTCEEAAELIGAVHVGIEVAGSPLATINDLPTTASIAGFGNNNGLILGAEVVDWRERGWDGIICRTTIDGVLVRESSAAMVPGGPLEVFAYALGEAARRGVPLCRGDCISTGAITGTPAIKIGQHCIAEFLGIATIYCKVTVAPGG